MPTVCARSRPTLRPAGGRHVAVAVAVCRLAALRPNPRLRADVLGSGAARQPWKIVRPAVHSCTVQVACGACGASAVRMRPIDPCPWGRTPCPANLERSRVGTRSLASLRRRPPAGSAAARRRLGRARPRPRSSTRRPRPAPAPVPPSVCCGDLAFVSRLHPTLQVNEVVAVAARTVAATGGAVDRVRTPTPAVSCSRQTRYNPDEKSGASYAFGVQTVRCAASLIPVARCRCSPGRGRAPTSIAATLEPARRWRTGADDTLTTTGGSSGSRRAERFSWSHEPEGRGTRRPVVESRYGR